MNHRLAVLFSVVAMMAVTCSVASISTSRANVEFKIVNQPGVPARLKNFVIENDAGKQISLLHYRVVNQTEQTIKSVSLKVLFFGPMHKPIGGEVFVEHMNLKGRHQLEFVTPLSHYAADSGKIVIAISRVETAKNNWESLDSKRLLEEMKE